MLLHPWCCHHVHTALTGCVVVAPVAAALQDVTTLRLVEELVGSLVPVPQFPASLERRLAVFKDLRPLVDVERRGATQPYYHMRRQVSDPHPAKEVVLFALRALLQALPADGEHDVSGPVHALLSMLSDMKALSLFPDWSPAPCEPEVLVKLPPTVRCERLALL